MKELFAISLISLASLFTSNNKSIKNIDEFMSVAKTKVNRKVVYENMTIEELGQKIEKSLNSNNFIVVRISK